MSAPCRVCVIGAGVSGIAAARALSRRALAFDLFGGDEPPVGAVALGLAAQPPGEPEQPHIDISRERMAFSDWPMPASWPPFPGSRHLRQYHRDYRQRFGLHRHLQDGQVAAVRPRAGGAWEVELDTEERRDYDALVLAAYELRPRWPDPPPSGAFAGWQLHGHDYPGRDRMRDRDVVVVGTGRGACELAAQVSYVAHSVCLSLDRDVHLLPLTVLGRPYDRLTGFEQLLGGRWGCGRLSLRLPRALREPTLAAACRVLHPPGVYGLPPLAGRPRAAGLTPAPHLLERLLHGRVKLVPAVVELAGERVRFADGAVRQADTIVWCTGCEVDVRCLPRHLTPVGEKRRELFLEVFRPQMPTLAFAGLAEGGAGPWTRVAELQGEWIAGVFAGERTLPDAERAARRAANGGHGRRSRAPSDGGPIERERLDYAGELERELQRAGRRAGARRATSSPRENSHGPTPLAHIG